MKKDGARSCRVSGRTGRKKDPVAFGSKEKEGRRPKFQPFTRKVGEKKGGGGGSEGGRVIRQPINPSFTPEEERACARGHISFYLGGYPLPRFLFVRQREKEKKGRGESPAQAPEYPNWKEVKTPPADARPCEKGKVTNELSLRCLCFQGGNGD